MAGSFSRKERAASTRSPVFLSAGRFPIVDLKAYLEGAWRICRRIDDQRRGERGTFDGEATFSREKATLRYHERGVLRLNDFEGEGSRGYVYAFPAAAIAEVYFEDGRFFHTLDLTSGIWSAEHTCGEDLYRGEFVVVDADLWGAVWHVNGLRKKLILDAEYRRMPV